MIKYAANPNLTGLQAVERPFKFKVILTNQPEIKEVHLFLLNYEKDQVSRNSKRHKHSSSLVTSSQNMVWGLSQATC